LLSSLCPLRQSRSHLREARERLPGRDGRPLSREALANRVGVVTSTLQKWETKGLPYADNYVRLADALGLSLDDLLRGHDDAARAGAEAAEGEL
jgi:transcriptional regulator with XRE-family HTH domain